jgi:hypothetical protein
MVATMKGREIVAKVLVMAAELITVVEENPPENRCAQEEGTTTKEGIGAVEEGIIVVM